MQEERLVKIKELIDRQCLMDDIFFSCLMDENIALAEIILQIILDKPDLKVERVATQRTESDLVYRGVRFDVFAVDSKGQQYNIEVQKDSGGFPETRMALNASILYQTTFAKGNKDFNIKQNYVIIIFESDYFQRGLPIYPINRVIKFGNDNWEYLKDNQQILVVNGANQDPATKLGQLMHDFSCADPKQMKLKQVGLIVSDYKKGGSIMYQKTIHHYDAYFYDLISEAESRGEARDEARGEARGEAMVITQFLNQGKLTVEDIAEATGKTPEEILAIKNQT